MNTKLIGFAKIGVVVALLLLVRCWNSDARGISSIGARKDDPLNRVRFLRSENIFLFETELPHRLHTDRVPELMKGDAAAAAAAAATTSLGGRLETPEKTRISDSIGDMERDDITRNDAFPLPVEGILHNETKPRNLLFSSPPNPLRPHEESVEDAIVPSMLNSTDVAAALPECHLQCLADMNKTTFVRHPSAYVLERGSTLTMECNLVVRENSSARILWLFQGVNPPTPQCSLTPRKTLHQCDNFFSVDHFIDTNYSSSYTKEVVVLRKLTQENSGYYFCMVEFSCCSGSHTMSHSLVSEQPILIYFEDYTMELSILTGVIFFLFVLICLGTIFKERRRSRNNTYANITELKYDISEHVLHVPILEGDGDSFHDESDN